MHIQTLFTLLFSALPLVTLAAPDPAAEETCDLKECHGCVKQCPW